MKDWKDIDLKTYNELFKITSNALMSDNEKDLRVSAIINGLTYEQILNQPIDKTREMSQSILFLFEKPKPRKAQRHYTLNGRKYNLLRDMTEMTTAQYIDYTTVITERFEEHIIDLLSIMLVPDNHQYNDGYDMEQVREDVSTINVEEALGICDFFITKYRRLIRHTLLYSNIMTRFQMLKMSKEERKQLEPLLKEMNQKVKELHSMCGSLCLRQLFK